MDFLDVQIYAGARHILGRPVQQQDYIRSSRVVKRWATNDSQRAAVAAWHAAMMLRDAVTIPRTSRSRPFGTELISTSTDTNLFHVPWCIYLATLTCWAFHHARPCRKDCAGPQRLYDLDGNSLGDESDVSDEMVWDAHKEMDILVQDMTGCIDAQSGTADLLLCQGRRGTNGLVWVVADVLSKVRWGIVHAGVVVLRGLVPMRLINQYETL